MSKSSNEASASTLEKGSNRTSTPSEDPLCRICIKSDPVLITPCNCRGTFAYCHSKCLSEWLEVTQVDHCDICRFVYLTEKKNRGLYDWTIDEGKLGEYKEALANYTFSFYACLLGIITLIHASDDSHPLIIYYLGCCTIFWMVYFTSKSVLYVVHETQSFLDWREHHLKITVNDNPKHGVPEAVTPPVNLARQLGIHRRGSSSSSSNSSKSSAQS